MNTLLFVSLFIPFLMIIIGFLIYKFPAKKINIWYGYKTFSSMKDQEHWDFAQKISGKFCLITGIITFILSSSLCAITYHIKSFSTVAIILIVINTIALFSTIIYTELKIKNHFKSKKDLTK